jgi:competence protein ComEA
MKAEMRKRLYAAQQKLAITSPEAMVATGLVLIMIIGLTVRHLQSRGLPVPPDAYAALDDEVAERAARSVQEAMASLAPAGGGHPAASDTVATSVEGPRTERVAAAQAPRGRLGPMRMDPNTASAAMLERLPGIGPALAARIVEHRELHGPFRRPRDITAVRGIGPATYERLAPYLYVGVEEVAGSTLD